MNADLQPWFPSVFRIQNLLAQIRIVPLEKLLVYFGFSLLSQCWSRSRSVGIQETKPIAYPCGSWSQEIEFHMKITVHEMGHRNFQCTVKMGNFDHLATFKIILKIFPNSFLTIFYMKMTVCYGTSGIQTLRQGLDRRSTGTIFFKKCWVVDLTLDRSNFDH